MCRVVLLSAILILSGCSRGGFRPGEEVLASSPDDPESPLKLKPAHRVFGTASWNEDREWCWIPVGTRLRIASPERGGKVMVYVLEGEYRGRTLAMARDFLDRP